MHMKDSIFNYLLICMLKTILVKPPSLYSPGAPIAIPIEFPSLYPTGSSSTNPTVQYQ